MGGLVFWWEGTALAKTNEPEDINRAPSARLRAWTPSEELSVIDYFFSQGSCNTLSHLGCSSFKVTLASTQCGGLCPLPLKPGGALCVYGRALCMTPIEMFFHLALLGYLLFELGCHAVRKHN